MILYFICFAFFSRLSSKKDDNERSLRGVDNRGFELDPPKSPWRYPLHRPALQAAFKRTDSASSTGSNLRVDFLNTDSHNIPIHNDHHVYNNR